MARMPTDLSQPDVSVEGSVVRDDDPIGERRLARMRWRCRRGMLENDLILARFLDARGSELGEQECAALDRLLDLTDNELWDALCGRADIADPAVRPVLAALRRA